MEHGIETRIRPGHALAFTAALLIACGGAAAQEQKLVGFYFLSDEMTPSDPAVVRNTSSRSAPEKFRSLFSLTHSSTRHAASRFMDLWLHFFFQENTEKANIPLNIF